MRPDPFAQFDAAYSLGALDIEDLAAYEAHLLTCADCRARVEQLRPTMRMLAASRAAAAYDVACRPGPDAGEPAPDAVGGPDADADTDPDAAGPMPDTVLSGLLRRAGRERARRRWVTRGVAGLAAACLVALVIVVRPLSSNPRPAAQALVSVAGASPVEATARVVTEPWGTKINIHCDYKGPVVPGARYALRVIDRDHHSYALGTWSPVPNRTVSFTAGTAVRRERIARVQVTLADGTPILQLSL